MAEEEGVHRNTIRNDMLALPAVDHVRREQLEYLSELKKRLADAAIKPDRRIELGLSILDRVIKLTGTAAPTRHENLNVNADPATLSRYRRIVKAMSGLDEAQFEQVLIDLAAIPRKQLPRPVPPASSPLWNARQELSAADLADDFDAAGEFTNESSS